MKTKIIASQESWQFASDLVSAAITRTAGGLRPVKFRPDRKLVQPYAWNGPRINALGLEESIARNPLQAKGVKITS